MPLSYTTISLTTQSITGGGAQMVNYTMPRDGRVGVSLFLSNLDAGAETLTLTMELLDASNNSYNSIVQPEAKPTSTTRFHIESDSTPFFRSGYKLKVTLSSTGTANTNVTCTGDLFDPNFSTDGAKVVLDNAAHGGASATMTLRQIAVTATGTDKAIVATGGSGAAAVHLVAGSDAPAALHIQSAAEYQPAVYVEGSPTGGTGMAIGGGDLGMVIASTEATGRGLQISGQGGGVDISASSATPALLVQNSAGDAARFQSTGGDGDGLEIAGHGVGLGMVIFGGSDGVGLGIAGNGSGSGAVVQGGATGGTGVLFQGGGNSPGFYVGSTGTGAAVVFDGQGAGADFDADIADSIAAILDDTGNTGVAVAAAHKTGYTLSAAGMDSVVLPANIITQTSIASSAISSTKIATGAITNAKFLAGAIDAAAIASNAITNAKIATGAITNAKFAANAIDAAALAADVVNDIWMGTSLTEAYAAEGATATPAQLLYMIWSALSEFSITSQTITSSKLNGTAAMTFHLDSATNPTSRNRLT